MALESNPSKLKRRKKLKTQYAKAKQTKRERQLYQDRLRLAKHYEKLKLYDESIKYYKLCNLETDVKRVSEVKFNTYLTKAKEFESQGAYDDAIRLYEQLNMIAEINRIKALIGKPAPSADNDVETQEPSEPEEDWQEAEEEESDIQDNIEWDTPNILQDEIFDDENEPPPLTLDEYSDRIEPQKPEKKSKKVFTICPFCGEELNLPKQPNFCPFCKESFE
ncbi:MAG: hypothetical protein KAJ51_16170 [Thermoplasmata archaeon]|nr:hypothetical protein [Thermoplasmata archaeon]